MDKKVLARLLGSLGRTPGAVAKSLKGLGCEGIQFNSTCCPIATFVGRVTGDEASSRASRTTVAGEQVTHPKPVSTFVRRFDAGVYPELVR